MVGATLRFRVGPLRRVQLHAEDYVYKAKYTPDPTTPGAFSVVKKQLHDVHVSAGVGIPLLGLGGGGGTER